MRTRAVALVGVLAIVLQCSFQSRIDVVKVALSTYIVEWGECNFNGSESLVSTVHQLQELGYSVNCTDIPVPLAWEDWSKGNISVHLTRVQPTNSLTTVQLWMLQGGPGGSGETLLGDVLFLPLQQYGMTVYIPDHRGTGLSTFLDCDGSQKIDAKCLEYLANKWGNNLHHFSITEASRDLAYQISSVGKNSEKETVVVYGVSYGTHWLNRLLLLYPEIVDRAIMDGVVNPLETSVSRYDITANAAGVSTLAYCSVDPFCSKQFPPSGTPAAALAALLQQLDGGNQTCQQYFGGTLSSVLVRNTLFEMMQTGAMYYIRALIPALIFRITRCNSDDQVVLSTFFKKWGVEKSPVKEATFDPTTFSRILNYNIVLSERWLAPGETPLTVSQAQFLFNMSVISPDDGVGYAEWYPYWNKYQLDEYYGVVANFQPLLMLQGQLDLSTPCDQAELLAALYQRDFVKVPLAGHVTSTLMTVGITCPAKIILHYALTGQLDTSCISTMPVTIDFAGKTKEVQQTAMQYFGTTDLWGISM